MRPSKLTSFIARVRSSLSSLFSSASGKAASGEHSEKSVVDQLTDLDEEMQRAVADYAHDMSGQEMLVLKSAERDSHEMTSLLNQDTWSSPYEKLVHLTEDVEFERVPGLNEFLEAGGVVTELPPEEPNPKKYQYMRIAKGERLEKRSEYAQARVPKGEALARSGLNLKSQDWSYIASTNKSNKITPHQIHAALAMEKGLLGEAVLTESEEKFILYVFTEEERYRSAAWSVMMRYLAEAQIQGNWQVRKRGIITAMAYTALDNFLQPQKFRGYSDRDWAERMGLESHRNWPRRWRPRYNELMDRGYQLLDAAQKIIESNF